MNAQRTANVCSGGETADHDLFRNDVVLNANLGNCWETALLYNFGKFDGESPAGEWGRSAAHAWSASPAIFCMTEILGIKPTKPAYEEFTVIPHPCGLKYAKGAVPTPYGNISVEWEIQNGKPIINISAPNKCKRVEI